MTTEAEARKAAATFEFPGYRVVAVVANADQPGDYGLRIIAEASADTRCFSLDGWATYWAWMQAGKPFTDDWLARLCGEGA